MSKRIVWLVLFCWPLAAVAETAYVTDILRLGLHRARDTSDRPFENLVSGTPLEILEQVPNYARVRTRSGSEGWVKSGFLVAEKPAQLRVAEVEAELERLTGELAVAQAAQRAAEADLSRLTEEVASGEQSAAAIEETLARLKSDNDSFATQLETYRGAVPLTWTVAALIVALIGGFVAGLWCLDAIIRRRHGGFRVY
jgi:SH3 domain protein